MAKNKGKKKMANERRRNLAKQRLLVKPEFPFGEEVKDLLSKIRSIPDGAMVKEVFLWELVNNATQALMHARSESLVDKNSLCDPTKLFIHIAPDETNHTLSIIDSGIGMTSDDLVIKLGSVNYLNKYMRTILKYSTPDADVDLSCIYSEDCQFGLGFYSSYMVADKVVISTKKAGHDEQYIVGEFDANANVASLTVAPRDTSGCGGDTFDRGTKVTLHLKEGHRGYLDYRNLQDLVKKYPKVMCPYPISILEFDENGIPIEKQIFVDDGDKQENEEEPWELLEQRYECIRELFVKFIAEMAENVKVVVSDRVFDLPCNLSVEKSTLEINPRHHAMANIKEAFEANPEDKQLKHMILLHFDVCLNNIKVYDWRHGTSFYENAKKTLSLRNYCFSSDEED